MSDDIRLIRGPIAWMARNTVAANLLMFLIVLVGMVSASRIPQETLPEASLEAVRIQVAYPGASPEEVEEGVVRRIEEQIEGIEGIRRITSVAAENVGIVTAELTLGTDVLRAADDVKAEVDRITTFPENAEEPEVGEVVSRRKVIQLAIHGPVPERSLKELAGRIKDDLTSIDGISYIRITGTRDYELSIEVASETLKAYRLRLPDVAMAIRRGSLDLPAGTLETRGEDILVRTKGQNYTADDFRDIVIITGRDGSVVRLGDIATIRDGFVDADIVTRFDGETTVMVDVYRTGDERVLDIVEEVKIYLEQLDLPADVELDIWNDETRLLKARYETLLRNGVMGLILVILCLGLFLNTRLAFWVSAGIFVSFIGTFTIMAQGDVTLNLISLVAFILALGIVVDDAIVVGENIFAEQERGLSPIDAAVAGVTRIARPVIFAVLTTMAAFAPLLFVPGVIGKFMRNIPAVIIAVIGFSLIESLFILPAHLSHIRALRGQGTGNRFSRAIERVQGRVAYFLEWNTNGPLDKTLRFATDHVPIVVSGAIAIMMLTVGLVASGLIGFNFFHDIEGENVIVRLEMPEGTPASRTAEVAALLETKGREAIAAMQAELPADHPALLKHVYVIVGTQPSQSNSPMAGASGNLILPTVAEVNIEVLEAEARDISTTDIEEAWREAVGILPGVRSVQFQSTIMTLGKPIQMEVSAPTPAMLDLAVTRVKGELARFSGVFEIEDDRTPGKREIKLDLKPSAATLGVTLDDLARQVRAAYYGDEALRIQRGRDEVKIMVRLPADERNALADLDDLRIRTAAGAELPLAEVASVSFGNGPSAINRRDRRRVTTVSADVNEDVVTAQEVIDTLREEVLPGVIRGVPGARVSFEGEQREQAEAMSAIARGFLIGMFVIFALLAIPFRSYTQPLVIMAAIPFGVTGAILGHMVMGLDVTVLSLFGIVGLSGVVVNDSLVLIDKVNQLREAGMSPRDAAIEGAKIRFRPILLTSLTTFLGVLPLILERSLQAQFLIPIAASLGFGILFSTFILLVLVPALVVGESSIAAKFRRRPAPEAAVIAPNPTPKSTDFYRA